MFSQFIYFELCLELSVTTLSEVFYKILQRKDFRWISVIELGRYCFKVSVAVNCMKLGGVFTEFGLQTQITSACGVKRHTSLAQLKVL